MKVLIALCLLAQPAFADTTMPVIPGVTCTFPALVEPPVPARSVEVRKVSAHLFNYAWIEDDLPPLPTIADFIMPTTGITTFVAPVTDGTFGMLSFTKNGEAELTKHGLGQDAHVHWTTQMGTCTETKG